MVATLVLGTVADYVFAEPPPRVIHNPCAKIVVAQHNPNCGRRA